jgi:hypothetical protein
MQSKPQLIAISTIVVVICLTSMTYGLVHLKERISKLEIAVADAHHIAKVATAVAEELQLTIEELQSEVEDLQNRR